MSARSESYWAERNALVDATLALDPGKITGRGWDKPESERTESERAVWDTYGAALAKLKAFDAAHGGTPIL